MNLLFGQQHSFTIGFWGHNWHNIDIRETPHFEYLHNDSEESYIKYLLTSWQHPSHVQSKLDINHRCSTYKELQKNIKKNGIKAPVIVTNRLSDDKKIIIDGNHRAAIGCYYDYDIPLTSIDPVDKILQLVKSSKSFYGSKHKNMPYQSIYFKDTIIVPGRRNTIDRFKFIEINDIKNKKVIDLGCNYGEMSRQTLNYGAKKVLSIEYDHSILDSAIRLSVILNSNPLFQIHDLSMPLKLTEKYDTGYCFSIHKHVNNNYVLANNINNNIKKVLYFESHSKKESVPKEILKYFEIDWKKITSDNRPLYRLIKK
jgi:2-polyprenyl-3-methyl-5-hydroxy-6-metoxy-1,4-benzoquinol methylase